MRRLAPFWKDKRGTTAIEYAVIATLISIVIVGGARTIGTNLQTLFLQPVANNLS